MKTYKQFINEAGYLLKESQERLDAIAASVSPYGQMISSMTPNGAVRLHSMHIKPEHRGQGIASDAVNELQRLGLSIVTSASAEPGSERRLHKFYTNRGFTRTDKGTNTYRWDPPSQQG